MASDYSLLPSQQNLIFRLIVELGLDPSEFEWRKVTSGHLTSPTVSVLFHKQSGFFFRFDFAFDARGERRESVYAPGAHNREERAYPVSFTQQVKENVVPWLRNLKDEIAEPDLWGSIARGEVSFKPLLSITMPDAPFNAEDQADVARQIAELEKRIVDLQVLSEEQFRRLHERMNEIVEASKDMSRTRWLHFAAGEMVHFAVDAAVKSPWIGNVFSMALAGFQRIVNSLPSLPPPRT